MRLQGEVRVARGRHAIGHSVPSSDSRGGMAPQVWHMHALPLSLQDPSESSQPRLHGPLARGEGPAEWIASIEAARVANWPELVKDPP